MKDNTDGQEKGEGAECGSVATMKIQTSQQFISQVTYSCKFKHFSFSSSYTPARRIQLFESSFMCTHSLAQ